jgi:hypothetical protein
MKNLVIAFLLVVPLALTSCTRTEKNVTLGAATGAVIGGVVTGRTASPGVTAIAFTRTSAAGGTKRAAANSLLLPVTLQRRPRTPFLYVRAGEP